MRSQLLTGILIALFLGSALFGLFPVLHSSAANYVVTMKNAYPDGICASGASQWESSAPGAITNKTPASIAGQFFTVVQNGFVYPVVASSPNGGSSASQCSASPLTYGLTTFLPFGETTSGTCMGASAYDLTGNNNTGTCVSSPNYSTGHFAGSGAMNFTTGKSNYVSFPHALNGTQTILLWFYLAALPTGIVDVYQTQPGGSAGMMQVYIRNSGQLQVGVQGGATATYGNLVSGCWEFLAIEATATTVSISVNASAFVTTGGSASVVSTTAQIGKGSDSTLMGKVADFMQFNYALPQALISEAFNSQIPNLEHQVTGVGLTFTTNFYQQYLTTADYSVNGGGTPANPSLTYANIGTNQTLTVTTSPQNIYADASKYNFQNPTPNLNTKIRWYSTNSSIGGTIASSALYDPIYNQQFNVTLLATPSSDGTTNPASNSWITTGSVIYIQALYSSPPYALKQWTTKNATYLVVGNILLSNTTLTVTGYGTVWANYTVGNFYQVLISWTQPIASPYSQGQFPYVTYAQNGASVKLGLAAASSVYTIWVDRGSTVTSTNPFWYDLNAYTPTPLSKVINNNQSISITYGQNSIPVSSDPARNGANGYILLAFFGSYTALIGVQMFLGFIILAICGMLYLRTGNSWIPITIFLVAFSIFTTASGNGTVASLLPNQLNLVGYVFLALAIAGTVWRGFSNR